MKKIRLYGCNENTVNTYKMIAENNNIEFSSLPDAALGLALHEVFLQPFEYEENKVFNQMFMLFQGFTKDDMVKFIEHLKEHEVPYGGIKVVETDHNMNWKVEDLFKEVLMEHELFQKSEVLKQVIMSANQVNLHSLSEEKQKIFREQLMRAFMILQTPNRDLEMVDSCIKETLNLLKEIQ